MVGEEGGGRKEKRAIAKKEKRKQKRREIAEILKLEEQAKLNDPEEVKRREIEEEKERERIERDRKEFEEKERLFLLAIEEKKKKEEEEEEEEEERQREREQEELNRNQVPPEEENDSEWEYVEDGPPEIIWQGNEIIVKKKKVKVKRKDAEQLINIEDTSRPTSNPFPPESGSFVDSKNGSDISAQQVLDNAAQQIPNFGTEQDKAHCPFQIKTGACRFGLRCSRLHFYPDKSCTLLIKNMYNGPGLAFEQDEGLEHTDEEVDRCFDEFYEDVHTEFLKFGEIVNFKVCKNSSFHLRGNLYVHYKSLDSAMLAYQSVNGRYFAGKQVTCEFVGVTKWRVAICGEFMRSRLKTCSRGTACNFIHCFRNPGGDYEWADWDKPPPKYWVQEMTALFGHSQQSVYDNQRDNEGRKSSEMTTDMDRHSSRRSQSRERRSSKDHRHEEYDKRRSRHQKCYWSCSKEAIEYHRRENGVHDSDSDRDQSKEERDEDRYSSDSRRSNKVVENQDNHESDIEGDRDRKRNRDREKNRDTKRDEDVRHKSKEKGSNSKWKSRDRCESADDSESLVEDKDKSDIDRGRERTRNRDQDKNRDRETGKDIRYKSKEKIWMPKRKSRDRWDSADDSEFLVEYKGKSDIDRDKDRNRNRDGDKIRESERDEDVRDKSKEKSSTSERKSRNRRDSADDSGFLVEDKGKRHKRSRKSPRHSNGDRGYNEDIGKRGRWDERMGVENYEACTGEYKSSD